MTRPRHSRHPDFQRQRGAALMIMLVIIVLGFASVLLDSLRGLTPQLERDRQTAAALAQAKDALLGFAASVALTPSGTRRPGDLPCPDLNNDGTAETSCSLQGQRLGRLPWKTLKLPDLRDGSGERLWYAVSTAFKNNPRAGQLNSDTRGTISVRASDGGIVYDASAGSGAVAVIIAPGDVLQRTDQPVLQNRSGAGINTPSSYLDTAGGEDNADFTDGSGNGFIQGIVRDTNGRTIANDQLLAISQSSIMQVIQKRVGAEVRQCLVAYASDPANQGRYPWAARVDPGSLGYADQSDQRFGRIPDTPFDNTLADSGGQMSDTWTGNCNINSSSGWWLNWKEMVFYGLANAYRPVDPITIPTAAACSPAGECLTVNPPSAAANRQVVVIVAGRALPGQVRASVADKGTLANYLEPPDPQVAMPALLFSQQPATEAFNDTVVPFP